MTLDPSSVGIVAVGDELLAGAHPDLNSPYLAHRLPEFGRSVRRVIVVGDDEDDIARAVSELASDCALVFVSGGLGPTLDDVTRHGVAKAVGAALVESDDAWAEVRAWFERAGRPVAASNRRQALLPAGAERVPNGFGTAPGFRARHHSGAEVIVLPGPPGELQGVFGEVIEPWLTARPVDSSYRAKAILVFGDLPESEFAEATARWMARGANPLVGVTVKEGILTARCVAVAGTSAEAERMATSRAAEIRALFAERYLGDEVGSLGVLVANFLIDAGLSFTVAESCTGGRVAAALTDAPGVSAVFPGSYVTYANEWKADALGVSQDTLDRHGAVSEACALEMAFGALRRADVDLSVSVTGVAGPSGGSEAKPVGLVWFGIASRGADGATRTRAVERRWPPVGRTRIRAWATHKALGLLLEEARTLRLERG